jgi:hypothetical protein
MHDLTAGSAKYGCHPMCGQTSISPVDGLSLQTLLLLQDLFCSNFNTSLFADRVHGQEDCSTASSSGSMQA